MSIVPSRLGFVAFVLLAACGARTVAPDASGRIQLREGLEVLQVPVSELGVAPEFGLLTLVYFEPGQFRQTQVDDGQVNREFFAQVQTFNPVC